MTEIQFFRGPPSQRASPQPDIVSRILALKPDAEGLYPREDMVTSLLAVASNWAYSDAPTMAMMMTRQGLRNNTCERICVLNDAMFVSSTVYLIRSECGRLGILCFRGTDPKNVISWLTDASVATVPVPGMGRVHGGFHRNTRATWDLIVNALSAAVDGKDRVPRNGNGATKRADGDVPTDTRQPLEALYITGHSLGGAMAVLAAAYAYSDRTSFKNVTAKLRGVYTFGQPMVGDHTFARWCEANFTQPLFRFVYHHDIVPCLPPFSTGSFAHFGKQFSANGTGWAESDRMARAVLSVAVSFPLGVLSWVFNQFPILNEIRLPWSWDDHSPIYYVSTSLRALDQASEFDV